MKTAISVPDAIFNEVERKVDELGWSRSEFYATAAEQLLERLSRESLSKAIDEAVQLIDGDDSSSVVATGVGRRLLNETAW